MENDRIIEVTSTSELSAAYDILSNMEGGGEIVISAGTTDLAIQLTGGGEQLVTIRSADSEVPATITQVYIKNADNIAIQNLDLDSAGLDRGVGTYDPEAYDLYVGGSSRISLDNIHFSGQASGIYDSADPTAELGSIRYSENVSITNSTISNYFHGIFLYESSGIDIAGNELTRLQGDGIRMEGVQDVSIFDNNFHSFYGSPNANNHDDMIQMWTVNTETVSRDIEIISNVFDTSDGAGSQTILIQNERDQDNPDAWYTNITISDNVIYNSHLHGIRVSSTHGVEISNNTVLWNADSGLIQSSLDDIQSMQPQIEVYRVTDASVTGNITSALSLEEGVFSSGNRIVTYDDPSDPNYIGKHFVNAMTSGLADLRDFSLNVDSIWLGSGSELSQPEHAIANDQAVMQVFQGTEDIWQKVLSAGMSSVTGNDVSFVWTLSDGTKFFGETVALQFDAYGEHDVTLEVLRGGEIIDAITRTTTIENRSFVEFDFTAGLDEISGNQISYWGLEPSNLVDDGYQIGGSEKFYISRGNDEIHGLDHFAMEIDLALDAPGETGRFFHLHGSMKAGVGSDGEVHFNLLTDEGSFEVRSGDVGIKDTEMHSITVAYDAIKQSLELFLDGELVDETLATGQTTSDEAQHLIIGNAHGDSLKATIGSFYLGYDTQRDEINVTNDDNSEDETPSEAAPEGPETENSGNDIPTEPETGRGYDNDDLPEILVDADDDWKTGFFIFDFFLRLFRDSKSPNSDFEPDLHQAATVEEQQFLPYLVRSEEDIAAVYEEVSMAENQEDYGSIDGVWVF